MLIDIGNISTLNQESFKAVNQELDGIFIDNYQPPAQDWLIQITEKFCQDRAIYNAVRESIQVLDGKGNLLKESIPEILSKALAVSFDTNVGHDYLEDSEKRFNFYHEDRFRIPFDIEFLNTITGGGLSPKTFNVFMGGPGTGKTLIMCHLAAAYLAMGKNVVYITLEMAEERISERIDANLLNVPITDLENLSRTQYEAKMDKVRSKTTGKLIVKEYPTSQAGAAHFRHLLNELALKKNFVPEIVIVDYINICMSSRFKFGANVNSYTYIKSISEELRGLAVEKQIVLISATQINREGFASSDMGMQNTAESFGLPATADLFLGIITNEELNELGQIMIKQLKNRYNDPTKHSKFVVGIDREKMRIYDVEQTAQEDIDQGPAFDKSSFGAGLDAEADAFFRKKKDFSGLKII